MLTGIASISLVAAACAVGNSNDNSPGVRDDFIRRQIAENRIPLFRTPRRVVAECLDAQSDVAFRVLCPRRLPRPRRRCTPASPVSRLGAATIRDNGHFYGMDFGYCVPSEWTLSKNDPARFLHFIVVNARTPYGAPSPDWDSLGEASLGGKQGNLYFVPYPSFHRHHLAFVWTDGKWRYNTSLHSWIEGKGRRLRDDLVGSLAHRWFKAETLALLDDLVASLAPTQRFERADTSNGSVHSRRPSV